MTADAQSVDGLRSDAELETNHISLQRYLRGQREESPRWLDHLEEADTLDLRGFFASRVVYYPGSGNDGHPVKLFGSTHSAHCFIYTDYLLTQATLESSLNSPGFRGYHTLARLQLREKDLVPDGWTRHVNRRDVLGAAVASATVVDSPFGFLEVLERDSGLGDDHGARRMAVLFLGADGIAAYDALFCQGSSDPPPYAVVLQDHGSGGNYDGFGGGGLLERIATRCNVLPQWLLVAEHTTVWKGYARVPGLKGDAGGMHNERRFLYERGKYDR